MKIAMLIADGGDGSASIHFFKDTLLAEKVAEDDDNCEEFGMNEGSPTIIDVADGWTPPFGFYDSYYAGKYEV